MTLELRRDQLDELLPMVYDDLRAVASKALQQERTGHTLQTTALVHEAYLRLAKLREIDWENKDDVLRAAVGIMKRVLIDCARAKKTQKRDASQIAISCPVGEFENKILPPAFDLLALDEALEKLKENDIRKAEIVDLRYFGGQSIESVARILNISEATVKRDWAFAKAWLFRELNED